jgi:hypothetical protein
MPLFFALLVGAVLSVVALLIFSVWGLPVVAVVVLALVAYLIAGRRGDGSVGTIERGRRPEPTGRPRKATGGAQPTNERVGG